MGELIRVARNDWDDHNRSFGISLGIQNNNHGDCLITENAYMLVTNSAISNINGVITRRIPNCTG